MPKPILSDSLFNADDVATAILSEANLQVTNSQLGVTDRSSLLVYESGWSDGDSNIPRKLFTFNGFAFISAMCYHSGTPGNTETVITLSDTNYAPTVDYSLPTASFQGDTAQTVRIVTNGEIRIQYPVNVSDSGYTINFNGFYRYA